MDIKADLRDIIGYAMDHLKLANDALDAGRMTTRRVEILQKTLEHAKSRIEEALSQSEWL